MDKLYLHSNIGDGKILGSEDYFHKKPDILGNSVLSDEVIEPNLSVTNNIAKQENSKLALSNIKDNDLIISKYIIREEGESEELYNLRLIIIKEHLLPKGIGPIRCNNISKILANRIFYKIEYSDTTISVFNEVFKNGK